MTPPHPRDITRLLAQWRAGDQQALEALMPLVYQELRRIAGRSLQRERGSHTLQPTALVHEAFLRLVDQRDVRWHNRAHFFAIAAQLIRRILVDHARRRSAAKRGAGADKVTLEHEIAVSPTRSVETLALDQALSRLMELEPQQARIVELRFFGGLTNEEVGEVLGVSSRTVMRDWNMARAWLFDELSR
jgi:RNA polymerase sigma factor (TIGR02999 family)